MVRTQDFLCADSQGKVPAAAMAMAVAVVVVAVSSRTMMLFAVCSNGRGSSNGKSTSETSRSSRGSRCWLLVVVVISEQ